MVSASTERKMLQYFTVSDCFFVAWDHVFPSAYPNREWLLGTVGALIEPKTEIV